MMNSTHESINDMFLNVRRAYRLLHDYQGMVRDAVRYISDQLDILEGAGRAKFAGDAIAGYRYLRQPSWDWLPMMACEFHFVKDIGDNEWLSLSLFIISDTGFIEGDERMNDKGNLPVAFATSDLSSSKFAFILRKNHWDPFPFMEDKVQMRNFIKTGGSLPKDLVETGFVGKCYDMSCLTSEFEADKVVNDVIAFASEKSWPLELKKSCKDQIKADPHHSQ